MGYFYGSPVTELHSLSKYSSSCRRSTESGRMTEYWVSQGNKWCDFCKIYIANNPASIRTHEFGQRHKDNVAKKLADIRKENASKEKEKQQALKDMERIEAQARRRYQKDLVAKERITASSASATTTEVQAPGEWMLDQTSGYFYNAITGYYHDPNSGLYYNEHLGKWTSREEAFRESVAGAHVPEQKVCVATEQRLLGARAKEASSIEIPGPVLQASKFKGISSKGVASSVEVGKRKRQEKSESLSKGKDEVDALKAREAAKKRTQEREKGLMGLYQSY